MTFCPRWSWNLRTGTTLPHARTSDEGRVGWGMTLDSKMTAASEAVPLRLAVLCVDCECVTRGLSDQCLVCGSHSLLSLERLMGGSQVIQRPHYAASVTLIDADIEVTLRQVEPRVLNAAVEAMSNLLVPSVTGGQVRIHVDVQPASVHCNAEVARAA